MAKVPRSAHAATLWGDRIERVSSVVQGEEVPVPNGCDATYATDGNRRWVHKPLLGADGLLAEALGLLLGQALGAPVPVGAVTGPPGDTTWLSEVIPNILHWDHRLANFIVNYPEVGRLLTLDAILLNDDRHEGNLVLQATAEHEYARRAWGIDMANALAGKPIDFAKAGMNTPSIAKLVDGIPVELIQEGAMLAAVRAQSLSPYLVKSMVMEACSLSREPRENEDVLLGALLGRMGRAPELVAEYLEKVGSRP
ncbi:hypothetical protein [Myxococcus sp. AB036A]|uniref:hypothetical protein n=1 Tax=Myxococcus sp. AB036A TaxID=2562793 RepID=UPI001E55CEF8|nr:hypothetical protein [Myxococcus sp. AB036A]